MFGHPDVRDVKEAIDDYRRIVQTVQESAAQLLAQFEGTARASQAPERGRMDLRTYGIGAQILLDCGVHKMKLMGNPRRMPSMMGYGLEIVGYITK